MKRSAVLLVCLWSATPAEAQRTPAAQEAQAAKKLQAARTAAAANLPACAFAPAGAVWTLRTIDEAESVPRETCVRDADDAAAAQACVDQALTRLNAALASDPARQYRESTVLVATLTNPPRTRVTLHAFDDRGEHRELLWDPSAPEGVQQTLQLPPGEWRLAVTAEDQVFQTDQLAVTIATTFPAPTSVQATSAQPGSATFVGKQTSTLATFAGAVTRAPLTAAGSDVLPTVTVQCRSGTVSMEQLTLDPRRAAAASTARGLLDQAVPASVNEVLSLLAEIAVARAKAGAMEILRDRFVTPMCTKLSLQLVGLGPADERAFPRACSLLEHMRLADVLTSGKDLVAAIRDDLRLTLAPKLLDRLPGLGPKSAELLKTVLTFANRVVDGESSQVAEVDLLIELLDRLPDMEALAPTLEAVTKVLEAAELSPVQLASLKRKALQAALPLDFSDDGVEQPWHAVVNATGDKVCVRKHNGKWFVEADRDTCIDALMAKLDRTDWVDQGTQLLTLFQAALLQELVRVAKPETLAALARANPALLVGGRERSCASRVIIAVAKWCSHRDRCSAGDIGKVLDRPWEVFAKPAPGTRDFVCVDPAKAGRWFIEFPDRAKYTQLAATLVSFLAPVPAGQERARTVSMIRWMFEFLRMQRGDDKVLQDLEELVSRLIDGDYLRAVTKTVLMLEDRCPQADDKPAGSRTCRRSLTKAIQLLGAVASYARTYEATASLDAEAARKARKEALEALIDSATDRGERGGELVVSLGANVGVGAIMTRERATDRSFDDAHWSVGARVPLGLAIQRLPAGAAGGEPSCASRYVGWHAGLTLADLGQFLAAKDGGALDDVRWSNFVSPGAELGVLIGSPSRVMTLTLSAAYAPALFAKPGADGATTQGAIRFGMTVGYYVPLFDLN
ncbi:MAG: hypothetical protein R3B06_16280 [Kofleriaceae bacterium]